MDFCAKSCWRFPIIAAVAPGKVTRQVASIVKNAGYFHYAVFAATIQKEMAWLLHPWPVHSVPAGRS